MVINTHREQWVIHHYKEKDLPWSVKRADIIRGALVWEINTMNFKTLEEARGIVPNTANRFSCHGDGRLYEVWI